MTNHSRNPLQEAIDYFNEHRAEIEKEYGREEYVVVSGEGVIDHDEDESMLAKRWEGAPASIFITNVADQERVYQIRSPRIVDMPGIEVKRNKLEENC